MSWTYWRLADSHDGEFQWVRLPQGALFQDEEEVSREVFLRDAPPEVSKAIDEAEKTNNGNNGNGNGNGRA